MRKGFEGLYGLVRERLLCEPLSGHLFLFCNAPRNRLKILVWDGTGLCNPSTENPQYRIRAQAALLSVAPLVWS
jgi:transposase